VRVATLHIVATMAILGACTDVREFRGNWRGPRVGAAPALTVGLVGDTQASLDIATIDTHGIAGSITIDGLASDQPFSSVAGAEADALSNMTFSGSPVRVYMAFVPTTDSGGDVLAVIALYEDRRVEVRLLRGGSVPIYAIFALTESS
jgi:hypothetical protein